MMRARSVLSSLLALAAATVLLTACGRLDKDAVDTDLGTVQSAGAEGMLVAGQAALARAPADFIEIRTAELSKQANQASAALAGTPTEAGLERPAAAGAHLGARISEQLAALHKDASNRALASHARDSLRTLSQRAGRVKDSL
jgi:hypothetical protein